ncbi:MAG: hypothetical protein KME21_13045 [Desmonostoc vinosum HA7617-LM4]|jgi:hypothetical protein|nr:hypothetical protein [Desmonostoc vinosum HA7617-LM4]
MTQKPLIDSGTQLSKTPRLKPPLAAALASLEVRLDQELARYRRARNASRTTNQTHVDKKISAQTQQLVSTLTTVDKTQLSKEPHIPEAINSQAKLTPNIAKTEQLDHPKQSSIPETVKTQIPPPPPNTSSIVPTVTQAHKSESTIQPVNTPKQPDDYLESSEALLRSLTEEQVETKKPSNSSDSLLSPLGIGSILLLLLSSLTLGYVVFNPKSLSQLNVGKIFNNNSSNSTETPEEVTSNTASQPQITPIPKYPNLAQKEFPEVRDSNDVVGLKPKVQTNSPAPPNPVVIQTPVAPPVVSPLPQVQPLPPVNLSPTPTAQPSPQPTITPPQTNVEITPGVDGLYHVVTDNQGESALAAARKIVPDAYLSSDRKVIYLAALKTQEQVKRRLQQLQAQGIKARIE